MSILNKNVRSYLKYAVGEIILVTVGILLAVSINNWNSEMQTKKLEQQLLIELVDELQYNIDRISLLDNGKSTDSTTFPIKKADSLFQMKISLLQRGFEKEEIPLLLQGPLLRYNTFNLNSSVYEQLRESGILNSLNTELKNAIKQYYLYIAREELYNSGTMPIMEKALDDCKYGFGELRWDYFKDSTSYLNKHNWIFDESSKHFVDMKQYLFTVGGNIHVSRRRMMNIIDESKKLQTLIATFDNQ